MKMILSRAVKKGLTGDYDLRENLLAKSIPARCNWGRIMVGLFEEHKKASGWNSMTDGQNSRK